VLQGDGAVIAEVAVEVQPGWLQELLARHLAFWAGDAAPAAVPKV